MSTTLIIDERDHDLSFRGVCLVSTDNWDQSARADTGRHRADEPVAEPAVAASVPTADPTCPVPDARAGLQRNAETDQLRTLLLATGRSDRTAFSQLYDLTSARVYGMVLRVLRDPGFSEETTQEVFLQIWKTAERYDPAQGSPLAWMMTLAHRRAVDRVRSEQSGTDREALYGSSTHSPAHDEVLESVTQTLESEAVVRCLETLTSTQRESVQMAYYGGWTYREVAERLGVAVPTVKSRIRDGLIKLKTCLGVNRDD